MLFVVLCPGTPEGSTGSGSSFKASHETGQQLKVSSLPFVFKIFVLSIFEWPLKTGFTVIKINLLCLNQNIC